MERMGDIMKICGLQKTTLLDFPAMWPQPYLPGAAISAAPSVITATFGKRRPGGLYRRGGAGFPKKRRGILEGLPSLAENPRPAGSGGFHSRRFGRWDTRSSWIPTATYRRC